MKRFCLIVSVLLMPACLVSVNAQNNNGIDEIKGSISVLEDIANNPNVPAQTRQDYFLSLMEKRGQLAALFQKQLKELQTRRIDTSNSDEITAIDKQIGELNNEIRQLLQGNVRVSTLPPIANYVANVNNNKIISPSLINPPITPQVIPQINSGGSTSSANLVQDDSDENIKTIEGRYKLRLKKVVETLKTAKASDPHAPLVRLRDLVLLLPLALAKPKVEKAKPDAVAEFTSQAENSRNDKQTGGSSANAGSTSLVTKGAVPAIFGFAVENGALTRTTGGTTVTFRGNPVGIIEAAAKRGYISGYQKDSGFDRALRNFSFGLSFDTSRGNSSGVFTGDKQQLSAFSLRYNFINQRDPRDARYTKLWEGLVNEQAIDVVKVLGSLTRDLISPQIGQPAPADFTKWLEATEEIIKNANADEVETKLEAQMDKLQNVPLPPQVVELVNSFGKNYDAYLKRRNEILAEIHNGWLVTAEYTNNRPAGMPSISNFNFIAEKGAFNGSIDLTANASISFFDNKPPGMNAKRLRDFHFSGQLDVPFGDVTKTGIFLLSFAGRYERLLEDQPIPNTMDVIKKGDIAVFQTKFVIPIRGTAFKIPLSFSVANRTDLLKEREIRGNFGFTFDLDSIFAKFNPFSKP